MDPVRDGDPRQIGPYRLIGHLGSGGMGRVFLGRSRGGRAVAVKVVHAELADDAEFRRRFADEVGAARRVGGFYTAQVVDADTDADPPWLATAYIPGPSLAEAVTAHGPLPATAVRVLGAGLAEGLAAIHSSGLVHRDLTHRNVILADDGPRVIDFGIAKALDTVHSSTRIIGTPGFMSPEQSRAGQIGPESDVFSLGCVLAYAATGAGPFGGGRADMVIYRIVHEEPDLDGVPADLTPLLRSCLAKLSADRPTLDEVLDQLETPAADATRWLPPGITTMITERGTAVRASTRPSGPKPPGTADRVEDLPSGSFVVSWSGKEPLSTYAAPPKVWAAWSSAALWSAATVAAFYFPIHSGLVRTGHDSPWEAIPALGGGISSLFALGFFWAALTRTFNAVRHGLAPKVKSGWGLQVGPLGIATSSTAGKTEFGWNLIQHVSIEEVQGSLPHQYTAVHIDLEPGATLPVMLRPAGWPYSDPRIVRTRRHTPICVLGPMTERQRKELMEAIAAYGGERWIPAVRFTTLPVEPPGGTAAPTTR